MTFGAKLDIPNSKERRHISGVPKFPLVFAGARKDTPCSVLGIDGRVGL
jgi:hypothetical protein